MEIRGADWFFLGDIFHSACWSRIDETKQMAEFVFDHGCFQAPTLGLSVAAGRISDRWMIQNDRR